MAGRRLRIGAVAREAGVNVQTLRYYERRGLLRPPERTAAGYREYAPEAVRLVRFIKRAQGLGFTLGEIAGLARLRDTAGRRRDEVRDVAERKIGDIDRKLMRLRAMRSALSKLVESCACGEGRPACPILEALDGDEEGVTAEARRVRVRR